MSTTEQGLALGRKAFLWACGLDVAVRKPGNVSRASPGHGMTADTFLASAGAAAGPLFERGRPVGERIEAAVAASWAEVGCNTNLGIVLLCAPLAAALERLPDNALFGDQRSGDQHSGDQHYGDHRSGGDGRIAANEKRVIDVQALRMAVGEVLAALDVHDACAAYRGIALANPGGLGRANVQDVAEVPTIGLRAAMMLAAERDSIARQYAEGYGDILDSGLTALRHGDGLPRRVDSQVQAVFLNFLAAWPDSHIVRKRGDAAAQSVTRDASAWLARIAADPATGESPAFANWDERLKAAGINPGTSADLTVCTLFAAGLASPSVIGAEASDIWHGSCVHPLGLGSFPTSGSPESLPSAMPG